MRKSLGAQAPKHSSDLLGRGLTNTNGCRAAAPPNIAPRQPETDGRALLLSLFDAAVAAAAPARCLAAHLPA